MIGRRNFLKLAGISTIPALVNLPKVTMNELPQDFNRFQWAWEIWQQMLRPENTVYCIKDYGRQLDFLAIKNQEVLFSVPITAYEKLPKISEVELRDLIKLYKKLTNWDRKAKG